MYHAIERMYREFMTWALEMICEFCGIEIAPEDFVGGFVRVSDTKLRKACARCRFVHSAVFVNANGTIEVMSISSGIWQDGKGHIHRVKKIGRSGQKA
jgi:hypothetical protein